MSVFGTIHLLKKERVVEELRKEFKSRTEERKQRIDERDEKLKSILEEKYGLDKDKTFETLAADGYTEEVIEGLHWIIEKYEFAVDYVKGLKIRFY